MEVFMPGYLNKIEDYIGGRDGLLSKIQGSRELGRQKYWLPNGNFYILKRGMKKYNNYY